MKCRQCQYYYFSPDGSVSPDKNRRGSALGSTSPSRSPKRARFPGAGPATASERESEMATASAAATRVRLEVSALELALHREESAVCRSEQDAQRSSEALREVEAASRSEVHRCTAFAQKEMHSAVAWRSESEANASALAQASSCHTSRHLQAVASQDSVLTQRSLAEARSRSECLEEEAEKTAALAEELRCAQAEIERFGQQSRVWERRRNLWEERCASCEGELEQVRHECAHHDAERAAVQRQLLDLETSEDMSSRLGSAKANALTCIAEDARFALTEHRACLATEASRRLNAERALEDVRGRHEKWCKLLQKAAGTTAEEATSDDMCGDIVLSASDAEVSEAIERHIRSLGTRLALHNIVLVPHLQLGSPVAKDRPLQERSPRGRRSPSSWHNELSPPSGGSPP